MRRRPKRKVCMYATGDPRIERWFGYVQIVHRDGRRWLIVESPAPFAKKVTELPWRPRDRLLAALAEARLRDEPWAFAAISLVDEWLGRS